MTKEQNIKEFMKIAEISSKQIGKRYRTCPEEIYSEALVVITENLDKYSEITGQTALRKRIWGDIRFACLKYRKIEVKYYDENGDIRYKKKRVWFDPQVRHIPLDELEDISYDPDQNELLKTMFYSRINDFKLDEEEVLFIDMCFSGLDPEDHKEEFVEAFPDKPYDFIRRGMYHAVAKKVEKNSPFNRSR